MSRPLLVAVGAAALIAVLVVGLSQTKSSHVEKFALTPAQVQHDLAGSPPALASLHAQADQLLGGGTHAVKARLAALRGHPVVVNKWASWCGPCRGEFPLYQQLGAELGKRVAFLGVDIADNDGDARTFLHQYPVTYPSYIDGSAKISQALELPSTQPITLFIDPGGKTTIHQGPFTSVAELRAAIDKYALQ